MPTIPLNSDGSLRSFTSAEITAMNVQHRGMKENDHVRYTFGPDGAGCTRKFSCAWAQVSAVATYFTGASAVYVPTGAAKNQLTRLIPLFDPDYPQWLCTKVEFSPYQFEGTIDAVVPGSVPYPEFARADFTAVFENVPYIAISDHTLALASGVADGAVLPSGAEFNRFVTYPGSPGSDFTVDTDYIGLPGGVLAYTSPDGTFATGPAGRPVPYPAGFVEGRTKFNMIWKRIPQAMWGPTAPLTVRILGDGTPTTRSYIGALNLTPINGYPPLTIQLVGVIPKLVSDPTGIGWSWDIGYVFAQAPKPFGHLGYYYHDVPGLPIPGAAGGAKTTGLLSGYYQILRVAAATASGNLPLTAARLNALGPPAGTDQSLFPVFELDTLFNVY